MLGAAALRAEPLWLGFTLTRLTEGRRPPVGGVLEDRPGHRAVPGRFAGPSRHPLGLQAAADLADGTSLLADPLEDLPHDPRLFGHDLIACLTSALVFADIAIAIGRTTEHVDRAAAGRVLLAPAAALHDLGALVLGDHALDLQEQILLGSAAGGIAQEDDLDPATIELLEEQHLIRILARKPIGIEDVEAIDRPGSGLIPESFEARPDEEAAADAVVEEAQLGVAFQGVVGDPLLDGFELTGDRIFLGL
jgi:hypothetical protein